jgi:hypothetical protein
VKNVASEAAYKVSLSDVCSKETVQNSW